MRDRVVIVGQAPSKNGDPRKPVTGRIGRRIADLAGLTVFQYLLRTERLNVLERWPGYRRHGGDNFPMAAARPAAGELIERTIGRRVILLGGGVALAFGLEDRPFCRWRTSSIPWESFAVLPHPSGLNRWWNLARNRREARRFLRAALAGAGRQAVTS